MKKEDQGCLSQLKTIAGVPAMGGVFTGAILLGVMLNQYLSDIHTDLLEFKPILVSAVVYSLGLAYIYYAFSDKNSTDYSYFAYHLTILAMVACISTGQRILQILYNLGDQGTTTSGSTPEKNLLSILIFVLTASYILFLLFRPKSQTQTSRPNQDYPIESVSEQTGQRIGKTQDDPKFESPIEKLFWDEWQRQGGAAIIELTYQYQDPDTRYRIDFVHLPSKIAIELDGYEYHTGKKQFTHDRKRQRELERLGWRFVRFSGSEIVRNVTQCFVEAHQFINQMGQQPIPALHTTHIHVPPRTPNEIDAELNRVLCYNEYPVVETKSVQDATLQELYSFAAWEIKEVMYEGMMLGTIGHIGYELAVRERWLKILEWTENGKPVFIDHDDSPKNDVREKLKGYIAAKNYPILADLAHGTATLEELYQVAALQIDESKASYIQGKTKYEELVAFAEDWVEWIMEAKSRLN